MEKIVKTFTRDLSITVSDWWRFAQGENFQTTLGTAYQANLSYSNGLSVTYFYLENDLEAVKQAFLAKLTQDNYYYLKIRAPFRKHVEFCKALIKKLYADGQLDEKKFIEIRKSFIALYPTYRFTLLIPSAWAEDVKKLSNGDKTIAAAFEDRIFAEGTFEAFDALLRILMLPKLKEAKQSEKLAKFMNEKETLALARDESINWNEIKSRTAGYTYVNGEVFSLRDYKKLFCEKGYLYEEEKPSGNEIKGAVAYNGGIVKGKVKIIYAVEQLQDFSNGAVLVTPMTVPDFIPAMKKASAIVTDEGGVTCHAAIVSRELKIPCVIGTRLVTRLFKDGDEIEVNTETGVVRKC